MSRLQYHYDSAPAILDNEKRSSLPGFDDEFLDIVDYILRITYRIWEGKQIGLCYDYYSKDCPVYTLSGYVEGYEQVVASTLKTLAAFPDRRLDADNVVWGGCAKEGFHTSHLIDTKMTNLGDSEFGPATGRRAQFKVIAHCVVKNNKIIKEWLVRDNYALVEQLGFSPTMMAVKLAKKEASEAFIAWCDSEHERIAKGYTNTRIVTVDNASDSEKLVIKLHNIWNAKMLGDVFQLYDKSSCLYASANRELTGHNQIVSFYIELLAAFSELKVSFDYVCENASEQEGDYIAVRWTMSGQHTAPSVFGEPTGGKILILGESHYKLKAGIIQEEYTVFDQLAVMTQIERIRLQANYMDESEIALEDE